MHKLKLQSISLAVLCALPAAAGAQEGLKLKSQPTLLLLPPPAERGQAAGFPRGRHPARPRREGNRGGGHRAAAQARDRGVRRLDALREAHRRGLRPGQRAHRPGRRRDGRHPAAVQPGNRARLHGQRELHAQQGARSRSPPPCSGSPSSRPARAARPSGCCSRGPSSTAPSAPSTRPAGRATTTGTSAGARCRSTRLATSAPRATRASCSWARRFSTRPTSPSPCTRSASPVFSRRTTAAPPRAALELTVPYYWNIAPNYDATISPRVMARRGVQVSSEFRYLDPNYQGDARVEVLPEDRAVRRQGAVRLFRRAHPHACPTAGSARGQPEPGLGRHLFHRPRDADRRDLAGAAAERRHAREGRLLGRQHGHLRVERLRPALADAAGRSARACHAALQPHAAAHVVRLAPRPAAIPTSICRRSTSPSTTRRWSPAAGPLAYPSLSVPLQTSYAYLTPKVGRAPDALLHRSEHRGLPGHDPHAAHLHRRQRRRLRAPGHAGAATPIIQTLEPRAYYVYIPFRDQNGIPNFDTGQQDINFATIYSENQFAGSDRINDANQITVGRHHALHERRDRLRGAAGGRGAALLFQHAAGNPARACRCARARAPICSPRSPAPSAPHWFADAGVQYSTDFSQMQKFNVGTRYQPAPGKVLNAQLSRDAQLDPADRHFRPVAGRAAAGPALARWNYSLLDKRSLEALAGVEYNGDCWELRVVAHRFVTATAADQHHVFRAARVERSLAARL